MKYFVLPRPHANSRYQAGALTLAASELYLLLQKSGVKADVRVQSMAGAQWLTFDCPPLRPAQRETACWSAHLYLLFEERDDGSLAPLAARRPAYLGDDLPCVLKYKGKTNETFTDYLINLAFCASDFCANDPITLLDPMCGRATSLFAAANRGWSAIGVDTDAAAIEEARKYFKKYLEFHRLKHTATEKSLTAAGRQAALMQVFQYADSAAHFKEGAQKSLSLAAMNGAQLKSIYRKPCCQLLVADLPYGVQHAPGGSGRKPPSLEDMLCELLPVWTDMLSTGGAMALSFNVNTLRPAMARGLMAEAGLDVMDGTGYTGLEHWVEQAITRDVAVAVKRF